MQEEMNQDHDGKSYVLNMVAKWRIFVLNYVRVCWPRRHTSIQNSLKYSPPPPPRLFPTPNRLMQRANTGFNFLNHYWANKLAHIL